MANVDLKSLLDADQASKPENFDQEVGILWSLYRDRARNHMRGRLQQLRLGIPNDVNPPQVSVLRPIVDKLAVAYQSAPTRWLVSASGERQTEGSPAHEAMLRAYAESRMDLALRSMDQKRALAEQAVVRLYGLDQTKRVEVRVFLPCFVHREPDPAIGSSLDYDARFALCLYAGGESTADAAKRYEYWERTGTTWRMALVNGAGEVVDSPYGASTFDVLPVQIFYSGSSDGAAWIPPRQDRITNAEWINALTAELNLLIKSQAHSQRVFTGVDPTTVPKERGPDVDIAFQDPAAAVVDTTPNPRIKEALEVVQHYIRVALISEDLPTDLLNETQAVLTGAAARQKFRGLIERREALAAMAGEDERSLWRRFRALHNLYADSWGADRLAEDLDVEVELGKLDLPDDPMALVEVANRDIAMGSASRIDLIQRERGVNRAAAIKIADQVDADNEAYPVPTPADPAAMAAGGPRTRTAPDPVLDEPGKQDAKESVIDAVAG